MSRPLRFCHVSSFFPPYSFGGDGMYLHRLVNLLARQGHEVDVIHCVDSYKILAHREPTQVVENHPNVTVHGLRSRWGSLSPLVAQQTGHTWPKTDAILQVLYSKKFDVIHYHNISLLGPKVLALEPDYRDFVKVYTTHEHFLVCPMHVLWKNNERLCDKPECFRCTLKHGRPPQWWRYTQMLETALARVDTFISPSYFTKQMHQERGFGRAMELVPHFVPAHNEPPVSNGAPPHSKPYFLFVGRLEKIKGVGTLFSTFRQYKHADLLIVGTGRYEAELRRQAEGMKNVLFLGALPPEKIRQLYRGAIAVLIPSICYEVFGLIAIEAFEQATPVIARALGGLSELVERSGAGFLYRTQGELFEAMEKLRTDSLLRTELGQRGRESQSEYWSEQAHLDIYFQLLGETARRKFGFVPWERSPCQSLCFPAFTSAGQ